MEKPRSSVFTRRREVPVRDLPLGPAEERRGEERRLVNARSERIRERLRRWLEQEL